MSEEKKRVNAVIDMDLYVKVTEAGYGISEAVTKGFEKLLEDPQVHVLQDTFEGTQSLTEEKDKQIEEYKAQVQSLNTEISRLKAVIMEAPDPLELAITKKDNEGLKLVIAEKDKRIEDLTQYKEDMSSIANYFKSKKPELIEAPVSAKVKPWWKFW